jgi:hypothetical protein
MLKSLQTTSESAHSGLKMILGQMTDEFFSSCFGFTYFPEKFKIKMFNNERLFNGDFICNIIMIHDQHCTSIIKQGHAECKYTPFAAAFAAR